MILETLEEVFFVWDFMRLSCRHKTFSLYNFVLTYYVFIIALEGFKAVPDDDTPQKLVNHKQ